MLPSQPGWLNAIDLDRIITGQQVLLTAIFSAPHLESVIMPRHLLEKYSTLFVNALEAHDRADPNRRDRVIDLYMNTLWQSYFPEILHDLAAMQAEWGMLKLFFKWMLCGAVVEAPGLLLANVSWEPACHLLFRADVAAWEHDGGMASQAPAA